MAQAEHLPIYKATYDLCLYVEQIVRSFSRYHKYTLGADLGDGARRVVLRRTLDSPPHRADWLPPGIGSHRVGPFLRPAIGKAASELPLASLGGRISMNTYKLPQKVLEAGQR